MSQIGQDGIVIVLQALLKEIRAIKSGQPTMNGIDDLERLANQLIDGDTEYGIMTGNMILGIIK